MAVDRMSLVIQKDGKTYAVDTSCFVVDYDTILEILATAMPYGQKMKALELNEDHKWISAEHVCAFSTDVNHRCVICGNQL